MPKASRTLTRRSAFQRGFTLVELLIVVAMVGVLATLASFGYRKYIDSAKVSEAVQMVGAIRSAEESFRAETMSYLNVSKTGWYPRDTFDSKKVGWGGAGNDVDAWKALNVTTDGPVRFGYKVNAGAAGVAVSGFTVAYSKAPTWPAAPPEPWYVVQAQGDPGERGIKCNVLGSSFSNEISYEND